MSGVTTLGERIVKHPRRACHVCGSMQGPQYAQANVCDGRAYTWRTCSCCEQVFRWVRHEMLAIDIPDDGIDESYMREMLQEYAPDVLEALRNQWQDWTPGLVREALESGETSRCDECLGSGVGDGGTVRVCQSEYRWVSCQSCARRDDGDRDWAVRMERWAAEGLGGPGTIAWPRFTGRARWVVSRMTDPPFYAWRPELEDGQIVCRFAKTGIGWAQEMAVLSACGFARTGEFALGSSWPFGRVLGEDGKIPLPT